MNRTRSYTAFLASVITLVLVVLVAVAMNGTKERAEAISMESFEDIDVFADISFVDLSWEASEESKEESEPFSWDDLSKNEDNSENISEDVSSSGSLESIEPSSETDAPDNSSAASENAESSEEEKSKDTLSENSKETSSSSSEKSSEEPSSEEPSEEPSEESSEEPSEDDKDFPDDVTLLDGGKEPFVFFRQDSPKWNNLPYGTDKIGSHGCGPTNMAMVISTITGKTVYPDEAAQWSVKHGYWAKGVGSSHGLMTAMAKAYDVPVSTISQGSWSEAIKALKNGKYLITRVKNGIFATNNHFIVIRGITDDGKFLVANSISYDDSVKEWSQSTLKGQVNLGFWVYG